MITLKTLPQATAQEVFDQVARHLLTQRKKSFALRHIVCAYKGESSLMCAAGCLMGDEEYKKEFEGKNWNYWVSVGRVPKEHCDLIRKLQYAHDRENVCNWGHKLKEVAESFELNINVLGEFKE